MSVLYRTSSIRHLDPDENELDRLTRLQSVNWILTASAIVLTAGRFIIRFFSKNRRIYDHDYVHLLALTLLVIHGVTNQYTLQAKANQQLDLRPGSGVSTTTILEEYHHLHVLNTVNNVFLYGIMWIVKVAFLLLYRQTFKFNKTFLKCWWVVFTITILTYIPPFVGVVYTCHDASTLAQWKTCNGPTSFRTAKLIYTCVLNVVTDVMVMALPLWVLSQLQMGIRQKIGLGLIFCVALFCVALDILRTAEALEQNQSLYTVLEVNFTVIVFCLPAYRRLFTDKKMQFWRTSNSKSQSQSGERDSDVSWSAKSRRRSSAAKQAQQQNISVAAETGYSMQKTRQHKPHFASTRHETASLVDVESQGDDERSVEHGVPEQTPIEFVNPSGPSRSSYHSG